MRLIVRGPCHANDELIEAKANLNANLHRPLGQDRLQDGGKKRRLSLARSSAVLACGALLALSCYTAFSTLPLSYDVVGHKAANVPTPAVEATGNLPTERASPQGGLVAERPRSGANVEVTTTSDGSVVTKYSPRPRDGAGPVLIDTPRIGQDPRTASMPNPDLLEDSPFGPIPTVSADGLRPVDQYARPWSGARGTRVAIVVGGLGLSQTGTQRAIRQLPETVTLAFAATGNSLQRWMQEARQRGHEILLQVPFEPFDYPVNDPGRGTLLTGDSAEENLANLHQAMARITNYTGVMNYMGARFLSDSAAMEPVIRDIAARGLLFLDDGSSARSLSGQYAKALDMPYAAGDLQLDGQLQEQAILQKLDELERIARRQGAAVGIASAFDETIAAVAKWSEEAAARGVEIVGVSALAADLQR